MFQNLDVFRTAMAMARHAGHAQAISAQNIANADTPGYRALDLPDFHQTVRQAAAGQRATRPEHLHGGADRTPVAEERREAMDPNGNTVSLELEMVNAVDAQRQHSRALAVYKSSMNILRTSLGRS
jgi:flagellar basal-body rod protein FlgB